MENRLTRIKSERSDTKNKIIKVAEIFYGLCNLWAILLLPLGIICIILYNYDMPVGWTWWYFYGAGFFPFLLMLAIEQWKFENRDYRHWPEFEEYCLRKYGETDFWYIENRKILLKEHLKT
jgi:hypothetical protein